MASQTVSRSSTTQHEVNSLEAAKLRMLDLGKQYNEVMAARVRSMQAGLTVIHSELCKISTANENEQRALLAAFPELILMAVEVR